MPAATHNISQLELNTPIPIDACKDINRISTYADKTPPITARK
jgi:hypothetical protein